MRSGRSRLSTHGELGGHTRVMILGMNVRLEFSIDILTFSNTWSRFNWLWLNIVRFPHWIDILTFPSFSLSGISRWVDLPISKYRLERREELNREKRQFYKLFHCTVGPMNTCSLTTIQLKTEIQGILIKRGVVKNLLCWM